jgi:putative ABC transport system substrate-binding protein
MGVTMRRGFSFFVFVAAILGVCQFGEAQQAKKNPVVGFLSGPSLASIKSRIEALRQSLRDLKYIEGQNIFIEWRSADGIDERLPDLVGELVQRKVDLICTQGTPATKAAMAATKSIPIVMTNVSDPVGTGLVASLAHPGGNVTRFTNILSDLGGKQLELLKEVSPKVSRVAALWDPGNAGNVTWLEEMKVAAATLRITLQPLKVHTPNDFKPVLAAIEREHADALNVQGNAVTNTYRVEIVNFAIRNKLPSMYGGSGSVEMGGLMSYGPNATDLYRRAAVYVDKILKGAKPADLPVEQPTKFEFIINLKAAKQIGLTIPPNVLARADRVIK